MKIYKALAVAVTLAIFGGCASRPSANWEDPTSYSSAIKTSRDQFKKLTTYQGPNVAVDSRDSLFMRAWKEDGADAATYQIYVKDNYRARDWRFYDSANDSDGNSLDTTLISRKVDVCDNYSGTSYSPNYRCYFDEHLGIKVSREYLEKNRRTGIRFQISGRAGQEVFYVPSAYIQLFLSATR